MALGPKQKKLILLLGDENEALDLLGEYDRQVVSLVDRNIVILDRAGLACLTERGRKFYTALKHPGRVAPLEPKAAQKVGNPIRKTTIAAAKRDPEALGAAIAEYGLMPDDLATLRKFNARDRDYTHIKAWIEIPTRDGESDHKDTRRVQRLVRDEMIKALIAPYLRLVTLGLAYCDFEEVLEDGVEFALNWDGKKVWHLL